MRGYGRSAAAAPPRAVYRRYFTHTGIAKARFFGGFTLTDEYLDEMAEEYYRCTACRRCKIT